MPGKNRNVDTVEIGWAGGDVFIAGPPSMFEPIEKPLSKKKGVAMSIPLNMVPWVIEELQAHLDGDYGPPSQVTENGNTAQKDIKEKPKKS